MLQTRMREEDGGGMDIGMQERDGRARALLQAKLLDCHYSTVCQ